jgi:excisionase family DNA binding protein
MRLEGKSLDEMPEWLDLKALQKYACVSERTLREWIHRPIDPLPAVRVGTKILVRRSAFDHWLEGHQLKAVDVGSIVEDIVRGVAS